MNKIITVNGVKYVINKLPNGSLVKKPYIEPSEEPIIENTPIEEEITQEDILAEILLTQVEILANQNAQDEVLAEVLLNSLEV